ncbi:MAG: hypothetical protein A2Y62_13310 [Candidatus Fischerbacteria bacterium RBG_13_37_8]|uniref:DUF1273 domain-containing protein n=1 Tax=Candidatus Fischerbacteria bacterium RBG_13_37_8 TaxID=1817863 RepID=A0A1F5VNA9_9BACT|nr:MAG: hypothetical protein A2Y62_13310 [Candidatus Fischerbacteria bacterium RBG_13_37_8]
MLIDKKNTMQDSLIPVRIIIGVTGHRVLKNIPLLQKKVHEILAQIRQDKLQSSNVKIVFTILSPVAEGADRLVAREILKEKDSQLEVVLPLAEDDYMNDFETLESKNEFQEFLALSKNIKQLPPANSRNEAYEQVGHYVVDNCDVLIALWNGKPAAGTAEIVQYAREKKRSLFWIHTEEAIISFEDNEAVTDEE